MERPSSEKVALLERVLNRIRENARDASSRARFLRAAPEPRKGAVPPHPAPAPTIALSAWQLPDVTPLAGAGAVSPPPPAVAPSSPPAFGASPPAFGSAPPAFESAPPAFGASPPAFESSPPAFGSSPPAFGSAPPAFESAPPAFESALPAFESVTPTPVSVAPSAPPPTSASPSMPSSLEAAMAAEPAEPLPPSAPAFAARGPQPGESPFAPEGSAHRSRTTQSFGHQEDLHLDVAFDDDRGARTSPPPPPEAATPPPAAGPPDDVTGVHPIAPATPAGPWSPAPFGTPPTEVDLASTIELPASELVSAVHSTRSAADDYERPAPASSPRRRTGQGIIDDDTYPAVSPSSLPPARPFDTEAQQVSPDPSLTESHVGMRSPSAAPPFEATTPATSDLAPPPLRRSEMPRPSAFPEADSARVAPAEPVALQLAVSPSPPAVATPEPRPAPPPLAALALEADALSRTTVQGNPANFVAAVRSPAPRTFGELLDASLALGNDV